MNVLAIEHQKPLVLIHLKIQDRIFKLKAMIDFGADVNMLYEDLIPAKYWRKTSHVITGVGNTQISLGYEIPKATLSRYEVFSLRNSGCMYSWYSFPYSYRTLWLSKDFRRKSCILHHSA